MKSWTWLILPFLFLIHALDVNGQNIPLSETELRTELEKRGLTYDEVREELLTQGIDIANMDPATMAQADFIRIEQIIADLEARKRAEQDKEVIPENSDEMDTGLEDKSLSDTTTIEPEPVTEVAEEDVPEITIYGQELFRMKAISLKNEASLVKVPDVYVLGSGDEIAVAVWGRSQFDNEYVVDKSGYIRILNGAQRVYLRGMSFADARNKLEKVFAAYYSFSKGEFDVALVSSRTVQISIYGEVEVPGPVTIPAINTAFNALAAAKGPNDIGSLRNIELIKGDGSKKILDIYKFMKNPSVTGDHFLDNNDVILVPVAENIVAIEGAVRRPMKYELIKGEGLSDLMGYCGGFAENAFLGKIQIRRYTGENEKVIDINWPEYVSQNKKFPLIHGDVVIVETIEDEADNFVVISGEVTKPGIYERTEGMRLSTLILKAGLKNASRTDLAYLQRKYPDGTTSYIRLNPDEVLLQTGGQADILLQDQDMLEIWSRQRFADAAQIAVAGAVRFEGRFPYDISQGIRISEAVVLAGGVRRDASDMAVIHRTDPLNPKLKEYLSVNNLQEIISNPGNERNYVLQPFDSLVVYSENTFIEESSVRIEGAINNPGEYQYGANMTIGDLLTLAGGFKLAASKNNIEVSRIQIVNNQPTRTLIANLEMDGDFNVISSDNPEFELAPFDNISVRYIPNFELQKRVFLRGEVQFPGPYAIVNDNETIAQIITRAGGITNEAFTAGATLERSEQDYGKIVIKLDEILKDRRSEFNFVVKDGDVIDIPKIKEFVTIRGATKVREVLSDETINEGNEIHVPFHKGKDALFYINEYAGGLSDKADRNKVFVEHPNGEIKRPKRAFITRKYPQVQQGSVIRVGYVIEEEDTTDDQEEVNWTEVLSDSVAQAMSILTLILLIQRLD